MQTENKVDSMEHSEHQLVHITVRYILTGAKKELTAHLNQTLQAVINEAYIKLEETPRATDQYFCHDTSPRLDLRTYLAMTLQALLEQNVGIRKEHGKLVFAIDIDSEPGGAVQ